MHYNIKGSVIDAQTKKPVVGAVIAVKWFRYKLAPIGLPTPKERYGTTEEITDSQGSFKIPNYPFGSHFIGIYKKGYVCWSSDSVFNPHGKDEDEMIVRRWLDVKHGMVIKLEPKTEGFPEVEHASFVCMDVDIKLSSPTPMFDKVTQEESETYENYIYKRNTK
ncbi:hypothetical protein DSCA_27810 [Desulfosarcina alkanivorans]|uniref:Carboxypeptidase regulatory-like domain-containing protein n=2 Tax=Desulfosarcina alkanivorans TaxID=571177 RepID=A0A5K7YPL8_9BACT|nr:hypothetical protein DSCA_27810 [Desulfosarcina alkanivorans]